MQLITQSTYAQELYKSYGFHAGPGTDKEVTAAVMLTINTLLPSATNIPTGNDIDPVKVDHKAETKSSLADVTKLFNGQLPRSISLVLLGEDHTNDEDRQRANDFIAAINNNTLIPSLVVFERGMPYIAPTTGVLTIRENNLTTTGGVDFGMGLSAKQRSMVVAGYLALLAGGGNQNDINKMLIFFGANHKDILTYFGYFAQHTNAFYLLKEPRTLFFVRSFVK